MVRLAFLDSKLSTCSVETISVLENAQRKATSNYAGGGKVGQSWTDKVMGFKGSSSLEDKQNQPLPHEQLEGVDDDEWVSVCVCVFVCVCVCLCVCVCDVCVQFIDEYKLFNWYFHFFCRMINVGMEHIRRYYKNLTTGLTILPNNMVACKSDC